MLTRREFLAATAVVALLPSGCVWRLSKGSGIVVNDLHSQLNATRIDRLIKVRSIDELQESIRSAKVSGKGVSIAGGRHAMGGQQFGVDTFCLDTTGMNHVLSFDRERGLVDVEAGIQWPELVEYLVREQKGQPHQWGIIQKQTGADRLCIGGALSANAHGRGLKLKPFIGDVESFVLIDEQGMRRTCSRNANPELFRLTIGGYGLFGAIASVKLRLAPRRKVERVVEVINVEDLMPAFEKRIAEGFLYGDFQYSTDMKSDDFLQKGVFSCYRPVSDQTPISEKQKALSVDDWKHLIYLGHVDQKEAFEFYSTYYLSTSGQIYWSDTHQLSTYIDHYHHWLDRKLVSMDKATEMITEIYVPRNALNHFLADVRSDFQKNNVKVIYGTIRLIEKDDESFLAWARESFVCTIFNLHVVHTPDGIARSAADFRRLIDLGIKYGGSYFPTYHRWASRAQIETCYPQLREFLRLKRKYDPEERFQSDWYRHYKNMFSDMI